jgi:hypothetical protein
MRVAELKIGRIEPIVVRRPFIQPTKRSKGELVTYLGISLTSQYLAHDLLTTRFSVEGGEALIPTGAGLRVQVDEAKVRRFAAD